MCVTASDPEMPCNFPIAYKRRRNIGGQMDRYLDKLPRTMLVSYCVYNVLSPNRWGPS